MPDLAWRGYIKLVIGAGSLIVLICDRSEIGCCFVLKLLCFPSTDVRFLASVLCSVRKIRLFFDNGSSKGVTGGDVAII